MKEKLIFMRDIPFSYPKKNVEKQFKVELWLNLEEWLEDVGMKPIASIHAKDTEKMDAYVV